MDAADVPALMLDHARSLLRAVGYGSGEPPFAELGIGLDVGEAFVGNIGQRALYDFTAVGDVVNTASRLQHEAAGRRDPALRARRARPAGGAGRARRAGAQGQARAAGRLPRDGLTLRCRGRPSGCSAR